MSLTSVLALPLDVLPPSPSPSSPGTAADDGMGTAAVVGIVGLVAGVIVLVTVIALYVIARRRRGSGGQIGGPQWNR